MLFGLLGKHAPRTATGPADARTASREALLGQAREFLYCAAQWHQRDGLLGL